MNQRPTTYGSRQAPDPYDQYLEAHNLYRKHTARDATCLFRCISEQMYDSQMLHLEIRLECVDYMSHNRGIFEQYVERNFDEYLMDLAKNNTNGTLLELRALSYMYKRNVLLYLPYDLGNLFVSQKTFSGFFRVFYTCDYHFDSVYVGAYVQKAALCQSLVYDLLYRGLFKIPDVDYAVEKMLHPNTFEYGTFHAEYNDEGYLMHIFTMDNRLFRMESPEDSNCILENFKQCNFHCEIHIKKKLAEMKLEEEQQQYVDNENSEMLLPSRLMSCVRQLLEDGITPFPYKVAKSLDPNIYRNIEFDSWNEMRKEKRRSSQYQCVNGYKVGDKCYVKLENHDQEQYVCYVQAITKDERYCVVYIAKLGARYKVCFDALLPLLPNEAKVWNGTNHLRHVPRNSTHSKYGSKSRNAGAGGGSVNSYWKKSKYFDYYSSVAANNCCKDIDFDPSGSYKLKQYIDIDNFRSPHVEYYAYPLATSTGRYNATSTGNSSGQQRPLNMFNERNMHQNNLVLQSNIHGEMRNLNINTELDTCTCEDVAPVVLGALSQENVNRDLNQTSCGPPPPAPPSVPSRVVLCSGGSYQNVYPLYEYTPQPIMQPHMPMFVTEEYIGLHPTPTQPLFMQTDYGQVYCVSGNYAPAGHPAAIPIMNVVPPPPAYSVYAETPNATPSVSVASSASNQMREEVSVAEQHTDNPCVLGNVEHRELLSSSIRYENDNLAPIVAPPPLPFQPPVVTPPHEHLTPSHSTNLQQYHEPPFNRRNMSHHVNGSWAVEHGQGIHCASVGRGKINLGVEPSTRPNGEDLPSDVQTLRYFFNLGVDHFRNTKNGKLRERRRNSASQSSSQIDHMQIAGSHTNNMNNNNSPRGSIHRPDYNNQFCNNNNNNYQRNNFSQQTRRAPSNLYLNNIESMTVPSPRGRSRDDAGISAASQRPDHSSTSRGAEQSRRIQTAHNPTVTPVRNGSTNLPNNNNNNHNIAGNVEQNGVGIHDYNMDNPTITQKPAIAGTDNNYDGFNGGYIEVLNNNIPPITPTSTTYTIYATKANEILTTPNVAEVPKELNDLQKTNEIDISNAMKSMSVSGGGSPSDVVKQHQYCNGNRTNAAAAAAKHNKNNSTPNVRQNVAAQTMNGGCGGDNSDFKNNIDVINSAASNDTGTIATTTLVETKIVVSTKSASSAYKNNNNLRLKCTKFGNDAADPQVNMNGSSSSPTTIYYNNNNNSTDNLSNATTPQILPMLHEHNNAGGGGITYDNNNMLPNAVAMSPTTYITYPCPTAAGPLPPAAVAAPPPPPPPQQQQIQTPVFYASKNVSTTSTVAQPPPPPQPLIITQQNDIWYSVTGTRPSGFPQLYMPGQQQNLNNNNSGGGLPPPPPPKRNEPYRRGDKKFR